VTTRDGLAAPIGRRTTVNVTPSPQYFLLDPADA
jgi:hypothetical protein